MNASQPRRWWLAKNKQRLGPFTAEQLRQMAASGHLQFADMLLEEGQQKWRPAGEIERLFACGHTGRKASRLGREPASRRL